MKKSLILAFHFLFVIAFAKSQSYSPVGLKYDESNLTLINGTIVTADATADGGSAMMRAANTGDETMCLALIRSYRPAIILFNSE